MSPDSVPASESVAGLPPSLGDVGPLPRDPRLEDPLELALEAAAIALASTIVQQQPQVALPLAGSDESQVDANADQGSAKFSQEDPSTVSVLLPPLAVLKAEISHLHATVDGPSDNSTQHAAATLAWNAMEEVASVGEPKLEQSRRLASFTQTVRVVPKVISTAEVPTAEVPTAEVSTVIVEATLSQATALSNSAVSIAQTDGSVVDEDSNVLSSQPLTDSVPRAGNDATTAPGATVDRGMMKSDDSFLASASPENPAAAFFAFRRTGSDSEAAAVDTLADHGNALVSDLASMSVDSSTDLQDGGSGRSALGNMSRDDAEGGLSLAHRNGPVAPTDIELAQSSSAVAESLGRIGTLGAKDGGVETRLQAISAPVDGNSVRASISDGDLFPQETAGTEVLESSGTQKISVQAGTEMGAARGTSSKPTVLPPVIARSIDLADVIARVLDRARSENPSHLAVEVRLEDGSSFGLEVRMNAAGLQASFRSESQPLLRALENNWATFIAKEAADQKTVSAAFEGRSGFDGLSDNNSDARERRENMEDNASSALLGALNPKNVSPAKIQVGPRPASVMDHRGIAVYA